MISSRWILSLAVMCAVGTACSGEPTGSAEQPGVVRLRLNTPNTDDGALLVEVHGAPIDTILPLDRSLRVFTRRVDDTTIVAAVVGSISGGDLLNLQVSDLSAAYTAEILEVASRQDALRASLAGYTLSPQVVGAPGRQAARQHQPISP